MVSEIKKEFYQHEWNVGVALGIMSEFLAGLDNDKVKEILPAYENIVDIYKKGLKEIGLFI